MDGKLLGWILSVTAIIAGFLLFWAGPWLGMTGILLLVPPLLVATGFTTGGIAAGLRNPYGILLVFVGTIIVLIVLHYLNPFGVGAVT